MQINKDKIYKTESIKSAPANNYIQSKLASELLLYSYSFFFFGEWITKTKKKNKEGDVKKKTIEKYQKNTEQTWNTSEIYN